MLRRHRGMIWRDPHGLGARLLFGYQKSGQNARRAEARAATQSFPQKNKGGQPGEHRLQSEDQRGVSRGRELLCPSLDGECQRQIDDAPTDGTVADHADMSARKLIIRALSQLLFVILLSLRTLAQQPVPPIPSACFPELDQYRAWRISIYMYDFGRLARYLLVSPQQLGGFRNVQECFPQSPAAFNCPNDHSISNSPRLPSFQYSWSGTF